MDPDEFPWSNQTSLVSSLDLLEEEVLREARGHGPQWNRDKHLLVEGEPAATVPREVSRISPRKPVVVPKASSRRRPSSSRGGDRSVNNAEEESESKRKLQLENERLQQEVAQWQREVEHARDEKLELEASFRRLDQEIGNGYHLAERKEKEIRIAELVTKNQKMSQLLERELQSHDVLRRAHTELQSDHKKLTEQVTVLNQVLDSVEAKHAELSTSHATLTASYEAAQGTIETLQCEVLVLQDRLATSDKRVQVVAEYEEKLRHWERTCRELEQKCERKTQKLSQLQKIASASQQEAQRALDRQEELEHEVRQTHDQMIQTNAAMRTMEAKLEANLKSAQHSGSQESLHRRVRHLEGELLQKSRANADLRQTCNQLLSSQKRPGTSKAALSSRNNQAMASRVAKLTSRIATLTDKLRSTEEARDRKSRSLDVLMQAFPFLLHRLDAVQDQFAAAVESNDIINNALEQMKDPATDIHGMHHAKSRVSGSMYLHLARDKYLMEAPYPIELLADQTAAKALGGYTESTTTFSGTRKKKFSPFRVALSSLQLRDHDNQQEDAGDDQTNQLVTLSADPDDASGASYLNRSKINAFLEVIQCSAARKKFKTLVVGKLAECLNKLRELAHRSASEAAAQQASIQILQREVADLQQKLKYSNASGNNDLEGGNATQQSYRTRQFLLKMVDVYTEKQQEIDQRQMTFLTQPLSSDILIASAHTAHDNSITDDRLSLADCGLHDDDVAQLLLKVLVSGVRFREIILDSNGLTDAGAQRVADFLEKSPTSVRVVSLTGNKRMTRRGIDLVKGGLLRHPRVQRVEEDGNELEDSVILRGLALERDFDVSGIATEVLRVVLPVPIHDVNGELSATTEEEIDAMTEKLRQIGFRYNIRQPGATSRQRSTGYSCKARVASGQSQPHPRSSVATSTMSSNRRASLPSTSLSRRAPAPTSIDASATRRRSLPAASGNRSAVNTQRQQIRQQQDLRFQSLEAAIRRASGTQALRHQVNRPQSAHSRPSSSQRSTASSSNKRKTHINTIRGLRR